MTLTNKPGRSRRAKQVRQTRKTHRIVIRDAAVKFFFEHAGYGYDPKTETAEHGRQRCAEQLARAERYAAEQGWLYTWQQDSCIGGDCGETATCSHPCCHPDSIPHDSFACLMFDATGENVLQSLGSICEPSNEYSRVVEAELAAEQMAEETK